MYTIIFAEVAAVEAAIGLRDARDSDNLVLRGLSDDVLGRWGGEEYMVVVTETNLATTIHLAERLRALIADRSQPPVGQVTVSFGAAMATAGDTPDTLVKRADEALYRAKQQGAIGLRLQTRWP